jgi:hypothetical protein
MNIVVWAHDFLIVAVGNATCPVQIGERHPEETSERPSRGGFTGGVHSNPPIVPMYE